jgi:hypothetical protein
LTFLWGNKTNKKKMGEKLLIIGVSVIVAASVLLELSFMSMGTPLVDETATLSVCDWRNSVHLVALSFEENGEVLLQISVVGDPVTLEVERMTGRNRWLRTVYKENMLYFNEILIMPAETAYNFYIGTSGNSTVHIRVTKI